MKKPKTSTEAPDWRTDTYDNLSDRMDGSFKGGIDIKRGSEKRR